MPAATKTLYVLIGLPFSGKTTIASQLMKDNDALLIERDRFLENIQNDIITQARVAIRSRSITEPVSAIYDSKQKNIMNDALTMEYAERVRDTVLKTDKLVVIVDGTHLQPLSRSFIGGLDGWRKIALYVRTEAETCIQRFQGAKTSGIRSTITPELIKKMAEIVQPPTESEGFDEIRTFG